MPMRIHVQDDLFFLTIMLRTLKDGMSLDIDAEIFLEKVVDDISFLDGAIRGIHGFISENTRLIDRQDYLHSLLVLENQFGEFLSGILNRDYALCGELDAYRLKINAIWDSHRTSGAAIREELSMGSDEGNQTDVVSRDELSGLLGEAEAD